MNKMPQYKEIIITSQNGITIKANHYSNKFSKVIIISHGICQNKDTYAFKLISESFTDEYDVICFDYRGHGKSNGFYTYSAKEEYDLLSVVKLAKEKYKKIGLLGFSLGAATAIITASKYGNIDSLIAVSTPRDFNKINYGIWKKEAFKNFRHNLSKKGKGKKILPGYLFHKKPKAIEHVKNLNNLPVYFIHGSKDWLIKPHHSKYLYDNKVGKKKIEIFENGNHAEMLFEEEPIKFKNITRDWFKQTL